MGDDEEHRARVKAYAGAFGMTMAEVEENWRHISEAIASTMPAISFEEVARNMEANLPALREAFGMRSMQESGGGTALEAGAERERQAIIDAHAPCETAENGTGVRCTCAFDCANYWLRAKGYKQEAGR